MSTSRQSRYAILTVQALLALAAIGSWQWGLRTSAAQRPRENFPRHYHPVAQPPRTMPLMIAPLYDDPEVVSDDELAGVLAKIRPVFPADQVKPNHVEHALRAWGIRAKFADPKAMSGEQLKEFLTDHGKFLASWGTAVPPLLQDRRDGVGIRWGKEDGASVHHDHWLACLTEAGVSLTEPIFTASQKPQTIADALDQALSDFRLD